MGIRSVRPGDVERFKKSADAAALSKAKKAETTEALSPSTLPTTPASKGAPSSTALPVVDSFAIRKPNGANNVTGGNGAGSLTATTVATSAKQPQLTVATTSAPQRTVEEEGPQAVLRALVVSPPVLPGAPAPSSGALERLVTQNIGAAAKHLSPTEQARVIGHPEWAEALDKRSGSARRGQGTEPNWLLAAQLTRWMRGMDAPGMSLADVAKSFKAANAMAQAAVPHLDGTFVAQLQKAYPFMPQWTHAPVRAVANDDWSMLGDLTTDAANTDVWTQKLDAALQGISEVPLTLSLTNSVGERLAASQPFKKHNVVMVQHMLGQAIPLCAELARAGMQMDKAEYVGVPYQKNPAVKLSLERSMGVKVTVPERGDIDGMWSHVCAAVDRAWDRHLANGEPILILDDGGYASKYIAEKYAEHASVFCVVEQTTRGLTEIAQIDPKPTFPIANVAGSYGKRFESAQVGDAVVQCVRRVLDEVATTPTRKEVLVVGGGKVGVGVADSFRGDGARVTFFDPYITPSRKKEIEALGYTVITDKAQALDKKFLVVGCSGHRSIDMNDFLKMSSPVFIASASSKRVEIDTLGLAELTKGDDGVMRRILAAKVNEQETWHYWTQDGRIVTAVADGLPANFQDVNSIAPELIDHTMALMVLGAEKAVHARGKAAGLVELDAGQQFELQAKMEGLTQQRGASTDIELHVGGLSFFGSKDAWVAIAKSPATPPAVTEALVDRFLENEPMHPVLLEALHQPKEISDASLDKILSLGVLAHVSRLMKNEGLRGDQEDRLVDWCTRAYDAVAGGNRHGSEALNIHGVDKRPDGAFSYPRTLRPASAEERARGFTDMPTGTTYERDLVTRQLGEVLFAHPRCPEGFKQYLLDDRTGSKLRFNQQANVHALKNPTWTTPQLEQMFEAGASFLYSFGNEKPPQAAYALDVLDALREHPSASEKLIADVDRAAGYITQQQMERRGVEPLGKRGWVESPLGGMVPAYA